jgi:predicted PurR-regulated permease PerM
VKNLRYAPALPEARANPRRPAFDLARVVLGVAALMLLVGGSLYILRPFLPAIIWGTMIVVATWPILAALQRGFGGRRVPAVALMLLALTVVVILPIYVAVATLSGEAAGIMEFVNSLSAYALPPPPDWLGRVPLAGARITREWQVLSDAGPGSLLTHVQPYATSAARWLITRVSTIGLILLHLFMTLIVCGILYMRGEAASAMMIRLACRIAPATGAQLMSLAALSIRAVALGVIVTALVQAALASVGLWAAGVPYAGVLTALVLILCIAQLGPLLPLLGAAAWLFAHGNFVTAGVLLVWAAVVATSDNILRPMLIKRGVSLPLVLIIAGVVGGLISFGIVGLFIGPVVLGVTFALMQAWIAQHDDGSGADVSDADVSSVAVPGVAASDAGVSSVAATTPADATPVPPPTR